MTDSQEIVIRIFEGADKLSSVLVGKDAHEILFGSELPGVLHLLGFETRQVANIHAVSEAKLVEELPHYTAIPFPEKTSVVKQIGKLPVTYEAELGLEIRPPINAVTIDIIAPFAGKLAAQEKCDFVLLDDRGKENMKELYSSVYSAKIIPFRRRH